MSRQALAALGWAAFVVAWLWVPALLPLMRPDEGRYAEIAREIIATGDWLTPHLNGYLYFEKPPLQYWATAAAFEAFGFTEWAARLWSVLGFLVALGAIAFTARRVFGVAAARASALVYVSSLYALAMGQVNTLDSGLAAWLTVALCAFLLAFRDGVDARERQLALFACWGAMALAMLSKGLIGLLIPGTVLGLYVLVTQRWRMLGQLGWLGGVPVFVAIAAPWFVLVSQRNPDFAEFFFVHEHFQRYLTESHNRGEPGWYFVALLTFGALPWTLLLPVVMRDALRRRGDDFQPRLLLAIWALFVLGFFSLSHSKLPGYLTPLFPALALLVGEWLSRQSALELRVPTVTAAVFWGLILVASFFADRMHSRSLTPQDIAELAAGARWAALVGLAGAIAAWVWRRGDPLLPLAAGSTAAVLVLVVFLKPYAHARSAVDLVQGASKEFAGASQVYSVGQYDQTLPFYLGRTVRLFEFSGEMDFGQARAPELFPPTADAFLKEWRAERRPIAVMTEDRYRAFADEGVPMSVVARGARGIVVVARP